MKNLFRVTLFAAVVMLTSAINAQVNPNSTYVNGYYKSNGTYVEGYYRTTPNSTINDNYSTYPNYNPYTGKQGTVQPEFNYNSTPSYNNYNFYSTPTYSTPIYTTPTYTYPTYTSPTYYYYK